MALKLNYSFRVDFLEDKIAWEWCVCVCVVLGQYFPNGCSLNSGGYKCKDVYMALGHAGGYLRIWNVAHRTMTEEYYH